MSKGMAAFPTRDPLLAHSANHYHIPFSLSIKLVKDISQRRFQNVNYRVAQWLLRQHCEYCVSGRQGMVIGKYELVSFLPA